jgi:hypothetical protein
LRSTVRLFAVLTFPLCYVAFGFASAVYARGREHSMEAASLADLGGMLLPAVVIYLVSLLFVRPTLRNLSVGELAAGSLLVALLAPTLMVASVMLLSLSRHSQAADYAFFFVVPFVPPVIACWLGLRTVLPGTDGGPSNREHQPPNKRLLLARV